MDERVKEFLEFVYCDLVGLISLVVKDGFRYVLFFVDDYIGVNLVYFFKYKSDIVEVMEKFLVDVVFFGKIKCIWSDNGMNL